MLSGRYADVSVYQPSQNNLCQDTCFSTEPERSVKQRFAKDKHLAKTLSLMMDWSLYFTHKGAPELLIRSNPCQQTLCTYCSM